MSTADPNIMARARKAAFVLVAASAIWIAAMPARAQDATSPAFKAKSVPTQEVKPIKGRFEVLHMMTTGIQVRSLTNRLEIHTFTYSDRIHDQMVQIIDKGGYQYGDKVAIEYLPATQIALKIKGKPSKPS